ncbi:hypothetical protein B938_00860 [Bacillus velezensis AS43.3]|nr:hypothetical protein BAMTA208_00845 [Bacillus amyloliquefaciens TA208]AFZ89217.1 hypothetical protein B938_00860 [Bacillus velezensis AS43.3]
MKAKSKIMKANANFFIYCSSCSIDNYYQLEL